MENLVKIKQYKVGLVRDKGVIVSLPIVWLEQNEIKDGDSIDFLQSPKSNDLILRKGAINQPQEIL
jgi:hypothetical protein